MKPMTNDTRIALEKIAPIAYELGIEVRADAHFLYCNGQAIGILSAGFEGKSKGTTTITFTTPCDWEGNTPGYTYVVTVEVAADGTIVSAAGE